MVALVESQLSRELRTLANFVHVFCTHRHRDEPKASVQFKGESLWAVTGREVHLCGECAKLLAHAFIKRMHCPMDPKPSCKNCPSHCYHPTYRKRIQEVMRYSGRKLLLSGRLDYLFRLLF